MSSSGELFGGYQPRECGEHRTVGPHRAWCHDCGEWCYPDAEMACKGCRIPMLEGRGPSHSFTRAQLVDALTRLETHVLVSGPAAGMINAESMADALIGALEAEWDALGGGRDD